VCPLAPAQHPSVKLTRRLNANLPVVWLHSILTCAPAGEGWHNTHHAFAHSARHGLEWYEIDPCYICICLLQTLGLAWDVRLPSEAEKARKRKPDQKQKVW